MRLTFLGVAGGRWVVLRQLRASGGMILELADQKIHIDPGPGALVRASEQKIDLCNLSAVVVSHRHQDHMNDAVVAIESMTKGATKKRGVFISSSSVINGGKDNPPILDSFHKEKLERLEVMSPGDTLKLGKVRVKATPTEHRDAEGLGFLFEGEGMRIGYTGDGEYFRGMEKHFMGCDFLVMNVLRPRTDEWPGHMNSEGALRLVSGARPERAVMQHFGMKMLSGVAEKEAAWISSQSGVKTVAARDGMVITQGKPGKGGRTLESFL
jgi:phosphoribosyl 1,2-cyclic phosphodiesterase